MADFFGGVLMGVYLNSTTSYTLYKSESEKTYFVDKTRLLTELFPMVTSGNNHICITRPRRFGKTIMANMITSYFSRAKDSSDIFDSLEIAKEEDYHCHLNQYHVIHISFNELPPRCQDYDRYIERIENILRHDLQEQFPHVNVHADDGVWDILNRVYSADNATRFIFVLDEWDYIFHRGFVTDDDKKEFISFLSNLLKDKPYVLLTYMTGILPIAKYSSGSELNMFVEYTMTSEQRFSEYFGFDDEEVDLLFARYQQDNGESKLVTRDDLRQWYDGYHTRGGMRLYNPRSIVLSLTNNNIGNYWTSSGPYDEIYYYIENNVAAVRDELALMVSGIPVPSRIREYAAVSMNLQTKEEIFSAMIVYGFLTYEGGKVSIPNRELMEKFADMLRKEPSLGYVYALAKESNRMLTATLSGDTDTMTEILEYAHNTEVPLLSYNHETELTAIVNLVYLAARDNYRVEREDKSGMGYVDFIFYPERDKNADCIILELKVDHTPEEAIQQIKDKEYALRFRGKLGERPKYTGRIVAVGIGYNKTSKKHACKVEILE